jgi:hypothetical protein
MALITYGTQLRAYFSRFFPELFGPAVLGVRAAPRARLLDPDPWFGDWFKEQPSTFEPPTPLPGSVRHILSLQPNADPGPTRWYSLWHLTDYLGFPLVARPAADLMDTEDERWKQLNDAYADEIDHTAYLLSVLTHSDYPRTDAYEAALTSALAAFSPATEGGASRPGIGE